MDIHTRRGFIRQRSGEVNKMYATVTLFIISCLSLTVCVTASTVASTEASTSISTNYSGPTTATTLSADLLISDTTAQTMTTRATTMIATTQTTLPTPATTKEPLSCYSCAASRENEPCLSPKLSRELYSKPCPQLNQTRCMILSVTMDGKLLYYQRECHDGFYFPEGARSPQFANLVPNNKTTCDLITTNVGKNIVCYRPCDTSFCNGPVLTQDECQTLPSNKSQNSASNTSLSLTSVSSSCSQPPLLRCYGCAATTGSDECVTDISGMLNTSLGRTDEYSKNCSSAMDRCMIIYRIAKGEINYYQRDCHDGNYFPASVYSSKLVGQPSDNQSYCDLVGDDVVCYISCSTDFCNGPKPDKCEQYKFNMDNIPEDSPCSAGVTRVRLIMIVVILAVIFLILH